MLLVYGLSFGEVLVLLLVAAIISYAAGIWTGKSIFEPKKRRRAR